jgi:hypothetical protein
MQFRAIRSLLVIKMTIDWNEKMKLYKYRSLRNFKRIDDIILNNRFHTSQFDELNDPMEGLFYYCNNTINIKKLSDFKKSYRICSFSEDSSNILLWTHYADGSHGICIEVDMPDDLIKPVRYKQRACF